MSNLVKTVANLISVNLLAQSAKLQKPVQDLISKQNILELAKLFEESKLSNQGLSKAIDLLIETPDTSLNEILEKNNLLQSTDTSQLEAIIEQVVQTFPEQVQQFIDGKTQVVGFLVGQCMKLSKGQGNPKLFNQMIVDKLTRLS
jgi:aspartyl-tRNA(Asn)/glutamyl-tRNA(Gln) amidotransferase subunit B